MGRPTSHKHEQDAYCVPSFKLRQVQEAGDSVLVLLPEAPGPSSAQKGRPCHSHPLRYWLHQMLATLRNKAENSLYNESVLRITWANSPPGEDTLPGRHHHLPSQPGPPLSLSLRAPHSQQRAWDISIPTAV